MDDVAVKICAEGPGTMKDVALQAGRIGGFIAFLACSGSQQKTPLMIGDQRLEIGYRGMILCFEHGVITNGGIGGNAVFGT